MAQRRPLRRRRLRRGGLAEGAAALAPAVGEVAGTLAGAAGVGAAATAGLAVGIAGGAAYGLARGTGWVLENTLPPTRTRQRPQAQLLHHRTSGRSPCQQARSHQTTEGPTRWWPP